MKSRIPRAATALLALVAVGAGGGCASVQPWERERLALLPMAPEGSPCQRFERNVEVYREGAAGANGGKSGGGCGCT